MEIKDIYGAVIYTSEKKTIRDAVIDANLEGAYLKGANLEGANLPIYCNWSVFIVGDKIKIGCKEKTIEEWEQWFKSSEEFSTKRGTPEFKRIEGMFNAYAAYYKTVNNGK